MRVVVDRQLCRGYANCVDVGPEVFALDEDDLAYVLQADVDPGLADVVNRAARLCPMGAITIESDA